MIDFFLGIFDWLYSVIAPVITFFQSMIYGLITIVKYYPKIYALIMQSVGYLPSIFVVFVGLTITLINSDLITKLINLPEKSKQSRKDKRISH